ncbi:DUF2442 domain-containing protein [Candidatus Nitronereus thalassa]|uniref:DUF2442 domain-containing protein n=1 Tax=Candidatus Nitronereus thalassa TaxID=3020898 RepID=A0ABU3K8P8_9BACT|nr:DUF2442 domain-containing protein [Candidatus Nitronereus thalassa]MDT7042820.1 DUF2442 domain-containing protein [Candidatus Nitronereus thalassa]
MNMTHDIHKVMRYQKAGPFTLDIEFEDGTHQVIDFRPLLCGELYGPLSEPQVFDQVRLDEEVHTLVWPNGADFDPSTLYNWPQVGSQLKALAKSWETKVG